MPKLTFIQCNPEASLFAELEADHREMERSRDHHLDTVEFPEIRCGVCQETDPEQGLTESGGTKMCDGCLSATLEIDPGSVAEQ